MKKVMVLCWLTKILIKTDLQGEKMYLEMSLKKWFKLSQFKTCFIFISAPCVQNVQLAIEHIYPLVEPFKMERTKLSRKVSYFFLKDEIVIDVYSSSKKCLQIHFIECSVLRKKQQITKLLSKRKPLVASHSTNSFWNIKGYIILVLIRPLEIYQLKPKFWSTCI